MLSNLAHLRQTSGRLLADLHRWRLTTCAYTPFGRPPADLHRWRLTTCAYTSRQTSGRPPADLQQTSSRYVHLEHSTTSAAPGGSSPSSSGMFLSHYRAFVVVCIFKFVVRTHQFCSVYRQLYVLMRTGFEPGSLSFFVDRSAALYSLNQWIDRKFVNSFLSYKYSFNRWIDSKFCGF